jgi:uncharacterized protein
VNVLRELRAIYAELPAVNCQQKCQDCCGPILASPTEKLRMEVVSGKPLVCHAETATCEYLEDGACSVYVVRPLICRLYGAVEKMRCPFGCLPERWVSDEEVHEFIRRIESIDGEFRIGLHGRLHQLDSAQQYELGDRLARKFPV